MSVAVHRAIPLLAHDRDMVDRKVPGLQVISYVAVDD